MASERMVATAPIDRTGSDILEKIAPLVTCPAPDEETILGYCENTIAFVSRGSGAVTGRIIEAARDLRVIGRPGAGYDTVDVAAATRRKIPVVYAPVGSFAVAEGALAMLMTLVKQIPIGNAIVKANEWNKRYELKSGDMTGRTLGIVGFGRVGVHLARLVQAFEMTILTCDPCISAEGAAAGGVQLVELDELLQRSDYVSLHLPLNEHTRGLIDKEKIRLMKKGAILVNTARGGIVESLDVLADSLDSGQLSFVGLDVFTPEPPDTSHRMFRNPRCVCTPHTLGVSQLAMERIFRTMATGMVAVLEGKRPEYCVNPEVLE